MKKYLIALALLLSASSIMAQEGVQNSLKVISYNVDGLPQYTPLLSSLGIRVTINPNCPGTEGTYREGQELAKYDADLIAVQEDFDFHASLVDGLGTNYHSGAYLGNFAWGQIDNFLLQTDGLGMFWKKDGLLVEEQVPFTAWGTSYGSLATLVTDFLGLTNGDRTGNGLDANINKGFRVYKTTLLSESGKVTVVDVYTLHMDAASNQQDIDARNAQWTQLANVIKNSDPRRPKVIMGDFNSRYTREKILENFVNVVEADKTMSVHDAWVETYPQSTENPYPEYFEPWTGANDLTTGALNSSTFEVVDKILYINPVGEQYDKLILKEYKILEDFIPEDTNKDHWPVYAEFSVKENDYDLSRWEWKGEDLVVNGKVFYLNNLATNRFIKLSGTELDVDINKGDFFEIPYNNDYHYIPILDWGRHDRYYLKHSNETYIYFTAVDNLNVNSNDNNSALLGVPTWFEFLKNDYDWDGEQCPNCYVIRYNGSDDAYLLTTGQSETTVLTKSTQEHNEYGASDRQGNYRRMKQANWRLISKAQKCVYNNYVDALAKAYRYITHFTALRPEFRTYLLDEIQSTATRSWDMDEVKDFIILVNSIDDANMAVKEDYLYGTYIAAFDTPVPDGMSAATVTASTSTDLLTLTPVEDNTIPAYTPVVLYRDGGFTSTTYYDVRKNNQVTFDRTKETEAEQVKLTKPAEQYTVGNLTGTLKQLKPLTRTENDNFYLLQKKNGRMAFYRCNPDLSVVYNVGKNRCWLTMNGTSASTTSSVKYNTFYLFSDEDDTDPIESAIMDKISSGRVYDLSGRLVANPQNGIYIKDGKKVFIKK